MGAVVISLFCWGLGRNVRLFLSFEVDRTKLFFRFCSSVSCVLCDNIFLTKISGISWTKEASSKMYRSNMRFAILLQLFETLLVKLQLFFVWIYEGKFDFRDILPWFAEQFSSYVIFHYIFINLPIITFSYQTLSCGI